MDDCLPERRLRVFVFADGELALRAARPLDVRVRRANSARAGRTRRLRATRELPAKNIFAFVNRLSVRSAAALKVSERWRVSLGSWVCRSFRRQLLPRPHRNGQVAAAFSFRQNWPGKRGR